MILQKLFSKIEIFFLFSLLIFFTFGISNALKIIISLQFVLIIFFLEFKIDFKKIFIAVLSSILLIFFSKNIDSIKIYLIFMTFLFSLNFEFKKETNISSEILFLFFFIFGLILSLKLTPHTKGYEQIYYLEEIKPLYRGININEIKENYIQRKNKFERYKSKFKFSDTDEEMVKINDIYQEDFEKDLLEIYRADYKKYKRYFSKSKNLKKNSSTNMDIFQYNQLNLTDKIYISWNILAPDHFILQSCNDKCKKYSSISQNRFNFNSIDVNLSSLMLLLIILLALFGFQKKKLNFMILYIFLAIIIIFVTKSRSGLLFFIISIALIYFKNISIKLLVASYFSIHLISFLFGYVAVNSVDDPMLMHSATLADNPLLKIPMFNSMTSKHLEFMRIFAIFDPSNYIRFSSFFQVFLIYINDFKYILLPDHSEFISKINYTTYTDSVFTFNKDDYHPHNFFMSLTKEVGLVFTLFFHFMIFNFCKNENFKFFIIPLIFGGIFLGHGIIYIMPTIFIFCFKTKNFLLNNRIMNS